MDENMLDVSMESLMEEDKDSFMQPPSRSGTLRKFTLVTY